MLLRSAAVLAAVAVVVGFLTMWAGTYSVAASRGHWPGFELLLDFAMRSSVRTHAMLIEVPEIGQPERLRRGAGHFQQGCAPCHGSPSEPSMLVVRHMLPPPSDLKVLAPTWKTKELFWIARNGLKYTGMPAWPAQQRDDEVWDVVAFLRALPTMSAGRYRELADFAAGEGPTGRPSRTPNQARLAACAHCHGDDGRGRGEEGRATTAFPRLDIQTGPYLLDQLRAYATGARASGFMQTATAELSDEEMAWLAEHYARSPKAIAAARAAAEPDSSYREGEALFRGGAPAQGVPACAACHGARAAGRDLRYPALLGQYESHMTTQLQLFRQGKRNATEASRLMATIAGRMTDAQVAAVAGWLAAQSAGD